MPIDATVGGVNANSYLTVDEATQILELRGAGTEWHAIDDQENALLQAAIEMDQLDYIGDRFTTTQAMKWPRWHEDDGEEIEVDGIELATNAIPMAIKRAQAEWALYLDRVQGSSVAAGSVQSLKIGSSVEVSYSSGSSSSSVQSDLDVDYAKVPIRVARHLRGLRLHAVLA